MYRYTLPIVLQTQNKNYRNKVTRLNKKLKHDYYLNKLNINKDVTNELTDDDSHDTDTKNEQHNFDYHNNNNSTKDKTMWNTVKDLTDKLKQQPPRMIVHEGAKVTSLKAIIRM